MSSLLCWTSLEHHLNWACPQVDLDIMRKGVSFLSQGSKILEKGGT